MHKTHNNLCNFDVMDIPDKAMESISIFDMLKVGIGPSSSHTLGPWRAAERWLASLGNKNLLNDISALTVTLYGSLALTGKGHATDDALILGLSGKDPETVPVGDIPIILAEVRKNKVLPLNGLRPLPFDPETQIEFKRKFLPFHANGMTFTATLASGKKTSNTYYSIGGGFVVTEERKRARSKMQTFHQFPFPIRYGSELLAFCRAEGASIPDIVLRNERTLRSETEIDARLHHIWDIMLESMYLGCHTPGVLPGGLDVRRRAYEMYQHLKGDLPYDSPQSWLQTIRGTEVRFRQILKWVGCFSLAVNEVNAAMGRVVTAPTNGSAGVVPAVLMYYMVIENHQADFEHIKRYLAVAGEIGSIFKKGATISAAMGGCQAEIGVSSAMAAAGLTELLGGTPEQVLMAAEIAMEHHLGLTCDPIGGLVQVPCIERNSMGAIKAINAAELAIDSDPSGAKVPLDKVVSTMWETAKDMSSKYKETSEGGLAVGVFLSDC